MWKIKITENNGRIYFGNILQNLTYPCNPGSHLILLVKKRQWPVSTCLQFDFLYLASWDMIFVKRIFFNYHVQQHEFISAALLVLVFHGFWLFPPQLTDLQEWICLRVHLVCLLQLCVRSFSLFYPSVFLEGLVRPVTKIDVNKLPKGRHTHLESSIQGVQ